MINDNYYNKMHNTRFDCLVSMVWWSLFILQISLVISIQYQCVGYTEIFIKLISVRDWIFWQELCKNRETKHCFSVRLIHSFYIFLIVALLLLLFIIIVIVLSYNKQTHNTRFNCLISMVWWSSRKERKFKKRMWYNVL